MWQIRMGTARIHCNVRHTFGYKVWSRLTVEEVQYWSDPRCPFCASTEDSVWHKVGQCPHSGERRAKLCERWGVSGLSALWGDSEWKGAWACGGVWPPETAAGKDSERAARWKDWMAYVLGVVVEMAREDRRTGARVL